MYNYTYVKGRTGSKTHKEKTGREELENTLRSPICSNHEVWEIKKNVHFYEGCNTGSCKGYLEIMRQYS